MADTDPGKAPARGEASEGDLDSLPEDDRRPTPVRTAMEGGEDEEPGRLETDRVVHDEGTGLDWLVTVTGRSASGVLPLRTISLMELTFAKAESPEEPLRQALHSGNDLADLSDHELLSLLERADPFRKPMKVRTDLDRKGTKEKNRHSPRD